MGPILEVEAVAECARGIATAIARRDRFALTGFLSRDFVHRTPGGDSIVLEPFLEAIEQIPGEILAVTLEQLVIDVVGDGALATGMQRAQVRLDGQLIDDRRAFVDWFVKEPGGWRLRVAAELPSEAAAQV
jgi:ketosteroid isomerase-like protein